MMKNPLILAVIIFVCCTAPKKEDPSEAKADTPAQLTDSDDTGLVTDSPEGDEACACSGSAYLIDPDTTGTNIRETPNGKIIGKLKYDDECECEIISFNQSQNGWLKLVQGGWVHGGLFEVGTRNYGQGEKVYLMSDPTEESEVVKEFDTEKTFTIVGCCGSWLQVKDFDGVVGWLTQDMICANPLTNCS
jgi:hypothetical protein